MKCPGCGLYHPAFYERCVACGASLQGSWTNTNQENKTSPNPAAKSTVEDMKRSLTKLRSGLAEDKARSDARINQPKSHKSAPRQQIPTRIGVLIALTITFFVLG